VGTDDPSNSHLTPREKDIDLKNFEKALKFDPFFTNKMNNFVEGGSKGLLLNNTNVRHTFDSRLMVKVNCSCSLIKRRNQTSNSIQYQNQRRKEHQA
jgi:hypothetical protein